MSLHQIAKEVNADSLPSYIKYEADLQKSLNRTLFSKPAISFLENELLKTAQKGEFQLTIVTCIDNHTPDYNVFSIYPEKMWLGGLSFVNINLVIKKVINHFGPTRGLDYLLREFKKLQLKYPANFCVKENKYLQATWY